MLDFTRMAAEYTVVNDGEDVIVDVKPTARFSIAVPAVMLISLSSVYLPVYAYRFLASTTWMANVYQIVAYAFFFLSMIGLRLLYSEVSSRRITFSYRAIGVERRLFGLRFGLTWYSTASMSEFGYGVLGRDPGIPSLLFRSGDKKLIMLLTDVDRSKVLALIKLLADADLRYPSQRGDAEEEL